VGGHDRLGSVVFGGFGYMLLVFGDRYFRSRVWITSSLFGSVRCEWGFGLRGISGEEQGILIDQFTEHKKIFEESHLLATWLLTSP
jgi:hypothetical protein